MAKKESAVHYRIGRYKTKCNAALGFDARRTRNKLKVTCRNCLKLMRLHGHAGKKNIDEFTQADGFPTYKGLQKLCTEKQAQIEQLSREIRDLRVHTNGLDMRIASLTAEAGASEAMVEKWRGLAERLQALATEGKNPLTGEEPEFWIIVEARVEDGIVTGSASGKAPHARGARQVAETFAEMYTDRKFYILPAFDYAISEVLPVAWKRKSGEKAIDLDDDKEVAL